MPSGSGIGEVGMGCRASGCRVSCENGGGNEPFFGIRTPAPLKRKRRRHVARVANLYLEEVRSQIIKRYRWSQARALKTQWGYLDFLRKAKKAGRQKVVRPGTKDIDMFWHQHILNTAKYAKDCRQVFGYFLHHRPD